MKRMFGKKTIVGVVAFVVVYIEVISYVLNSRHWPLLPREDEGGGETLRVLFVADPQIQGESNELPFFGLFTRWDADRYLQRNYFLAKSHLKPQVVIFLGDLFDEGSSATDSEYRRYYKRFTGIFGLPRKQDPPDLEYIFLPGDNDVGGEGAEPVDYIKLKWFNQTFGDMKKPVIYKKNGWDVQFLKMNMFVPEEYQNPLKHHERLEPTEFRIIISHNSLLKFMTNSVEKIVNILHPNVIFSAHSHESSHHELRDEGQVHVKEQFLLPGEESVFSTYVKRNEQSQPLQEFNVPTCSYRMGVPDMGFGAFSLHAGDGFEKRNRLRSKSVQNQAYRRKKNNKSNISSRGKNKPNGDSIRDSVPFHSVSDCSEKLRANFQDKSTAKEREEKTCVDRYFEEKYLNLRELFGEKERRNKTHSSFVIRLPSGYKGLRRDAETSKSFELPSQGCRDEPFEEGDKSLDMTWFRAHASHDSSTGSGMGANGSAHVDGRLKSRSQSSSALYCVGKSGGGNTILEDGSSSGVPGLGSPYLNNYGSDLNCHRGNHTSNGLSTSIPADIWDLPPTAKSFSPVIQKHHIVPPPLAYAGVPNSNHYQFYAANNSTMPVVTVVQQHQFAGAKQQQVQQRPVGIPCTVDAFSARHKKGGGKGGKNRAKLYAVSCPDVAQHTQCANVDHHHQHQTLSYEPDPNNPQVLGSLNQSMARLGIDERIEEGFNTATGGKSGFVNGGFTHAIVPDGYRPTKERFHPSSHDRTSYKHSASGGVCLSQRQNSSGTSGGHPNQVISNVQLAQSHPHLFVNTTSGGHHGNLRESTNKPSAGGSYSNNPAISVSYQNLPNQNSFYLHQEDSRMKHHRQQVQPSAAPDQQYLRKSRGSLPNQQMQSCEFPTNEATQNDPKCSLFPIPTFVIPENIFEVKLQRDQRGLGLSVTGGLDSKDKYPGLIRIKKVFPMSPASQSGLICPWDIILQANGVPLTGLTNHEALEVLRTTPTETILTLCRPPPNVPGFVDALDHSTSQPQLYYFGQQQMQNDPMNCSGQSGLSSKTTGQQHHHHENDGYTSGNSMASSSVFNPSVKSKSLSSLKIPSSQHSSGQNSYGEFEVSLEKVGGSLGFTLRQEDNSVLGHYVRALVKEPALTDGRIQPGDRILSVNGKDLSDLSHAEAINFLRQCPTQVTLRLYRDTSPTPISPLSPSESHKSIKAKPLRQEAIDMLNDLAIRKKMSGGSGGTDPKYSLPGSAVGRTGLRSHKVSQHDANCPATLPRRRHAAVTPSPEVLSAALSRFAGTSQGKLATPSSEGSETSRVEEKRVEEGDRKGRPATADHDREDEESYPVENRSSGSGESTPVGTIIQSRNKKTDPYRGYTDLRSDSILSNLTSRSINEDEATVEDSSDELNESDDNILRKKPRFPHFTMHLDQISVLDEEEGNASFSSELNHHDSIVSEPGGKKIRDGSNFRHGQPAYQSAILPSTSAKIRGKGKNWSNKDSNFGSGFRLGDESPTALSDIDIPSSVYSAPSIITFNKKNKETIANKKEEKEPQQSGVGESDVPKCTKGKSGGSISSTAGSTSSASDSNNPGSLLKWKGVLFSKDEEEDTETTASSENLDSNLRKPVGSSSSGSDQGKQSSQFLFVDVGDPSGAHLPQRRSPDGREFRECDMEISSSTTQPDGEQIFTVQLSRRWCSRLGFSLQGTNGHTYISAIYPESVAAKDGRLRVGDEVIMVNGETVRDMETNQVIDNMRKTRGIISITLLRKPSSDPEVNLSDSELGLR